MMEKKMLCDSKLNRNFTESLLLSEQDRDTQYL